jgi:hypothetical protein
MTAVLLATRRQSSALT